MNNRANKIEKLNLSKIQDKEDITWISSKLDSVKG